MAKSLAFPKYDDENLKFESTKVETRNIIVIGLSGSGKSSLIQNLIAFENNEGPPVKSSPYAVTHNLKMYPDHELTHPEDPSLKYMINICDTVGIGDTVDVPEVLRQICVELPRSLACIHRVIFCFKIERLRAKMSKSLTMLYNFFKLAGACIDNFTICFTFCDVLNEEAIQSFFYELQACSELPMMKEVSNITSVAFPKMSECKMEMHAMLEKQIKLSRRSIFDAAVVQECKPFHPTEKICKMPKLQFEQLCESLVKDENIKPHMWQRLRAGAGNEITQRIEMLKNLKFDFSSNWNSNKK